ncbi:hypothetical protein Hanom_Chr07g00627871 [Helianthus anomalus]
MVLYRPIRDQNYTYSYGTYTAPIGPYGCCIISYSIVWYCIVSYSIISYNVV